MTSVSVFDAKTNLSKYIKIIEEEKEPYVIITRNGKPVARLVKYAEELSVKIGVGKGMIPMMGDLEEFNSIPIEPDFMGSGDLL